MTGTDPENALTKASDRFTERFSATEREAGGEALTPETERTLYEINCGED